MQLKYLFSHHFFDLFNANDSLVGIVDSRYLELAYLE